MNTDLCFRRYLEARAEGLEVVACESAIELDRLLSAGHPEPECWANRYFGDRRRIRFYYFCAEKGIGRSDGARSSI